VKACACVHAGQRTSEAHRRHQPWIWVGMLQLEQASQGPLNGRLTGTRTNTCTRGVHAPVDTPRCTCACAAAQAANAPDAASAAGKSAGRTLSTEKLKVPEANPDRGVAMPRSLSHSTTLFRAAMRASDPGKRPRIHGGSGVKTHGVQHKCACAHSPNSARARFSTAQLGSARV